MNNTTTVSKELEAPQEPRRPAFLPAEGSWNGRIYNHYHNKHYTHHRIFSGGKEIKLSVEQTAELHRYITAKVRLAFASYIAAKKLSDANKTP